MRLSASAAVLMLMASVAPAQTSINTISVWDGSNFISSFGVTDTATYGETINVAASASPLNSFSFEIGNCGANVTMRGEVYAWDGSKATGSALFESAPVTITNSSSYQLVTFNTGAITLQPGNYVLFASTSRDQSGAPSSACRWGSVVNTAYPPGNFVYMNNATNVAMWTSSTWNTISEDLAFSVVGLAAPSSSAAGAPAASTTSLLIGFGVLTALGLFGLFRHRRTV